MKNLKKITLLTLLFWSAISFNSCSSNDSTTSEPAATLPARTTTDASAIDATTATTGGNVTSEGNSSITARGVCWATTQTPTILNSKTTETGTTGNYTSNLTGLTANTTYYVRAYASNNAGTAYGNQISFTTTQAVTNFIKFKYNNVQYSYNPETYDDIKQEIRGGGGINAQYKKIGIWMPLVPTLGVHDVTFDNANPNSYEGHFVSQAEALYLDGTSGTINITSLTATKIEGTFQFSGLNAADETVNITEGLFVANRNQ